MGKSNMLNSTIFISIVHVLNIAAVITVIFFQRKESPTRFAWLMVLVFFPIGGFILYMLFGHNYTRRERLKYCDLAASQLKGYVQMQLDNAGNMDIADERYVQLVRMNLVNNESVLTGNNDIRIFTNGKDKFAALLEDIRNAREYIHLLYFIFRTDELGLEILELLAEKAAAGVNVSVVYDDIGNVSVSGLGFRGLRKAGGKVYRYSPLLTGIVSANYRNHRKLAIIDGKIGYIGGMNIGREYMEGRGKLVPWRDTHVRVEGAAVGAMEAVFLGDYVYAAGKKDEIDDLSRFLHPENTFSGKRMAQILTSSPQIGQYHIHSAYAKMISSARDYIYIHTPYLVPDGTIMDCLRMAAASGVDVRIMIPEHPDKRFVYYATLYNARFLCGLGIKFYRHRGFIHSKMLVADDQVLSIGSANMDIRSFFLSYEANILVYDREIAQSQKKQFEADMEDCLVTDIAYFSSLSFPARAMMPVCQLFSPLL